MIASQLTRDLCCRFWLHKFASSVFLLSLSLPACATQDPFVIPSLLAPSVQQSAPLPQQVQMLRWAIIGQESGAKFQSVNRHSGALGYAQVMPSNLAAWSQEALGYAVSRQEFLDNPALQVAIIDYKLNQYWQRSLLASDGNEALAIMRVASWWYSGKPDRYTSTRSQFYNGHRYPSIAAYSRSVLQRYRNLSDGSENAATRPDAVFSEQGG
jgi:hypothetical protein